MVDKTQAMAERLRARKAFLVAEIESLLETKLFYQAFQMDVDNEHIKLFDLVSQFTDFVSNGLKTMELRFEAESDTYVATKMNFKTELDLFLQEHLAYASMFNDANVVSSELELAKESYKAYSDSFQSYQNCFEKYESAYVSLRGYFEGLKASLEKH